MEDTQLEICGANWFIRGLTGLTVVLGRMRENKTPLTEAQLGELQNDVHQLVYEIQELTDQFNARAK